MDFSLLGFLVAGRRICSRAAAAAATSWITRMDTPTCRRSSFVPMRRSCRQQVALVEVQWQNNLTLEAADWSLPTSANTARLSYEGRRTLFLIKSEPFNEWHVFLFCFFFFLQLELLTIQGSNVCIRVVFPRVTWPYRFVGNVCVRSLSEIAIWSTWVGKWSEVSASALSDRRQREKQVKQGEAEKSIWGQCESMIIARRFHNLCCTRTINWTATSELTMDSNRVGKCYHVLWTEFCPLHQLSSIVVMSSFFLSVESVCGCGSLTATAADGDRRSRHLLEHWHENSPKSYPDQSSSSWRLHLLVECISVASLSLSHLYMDMLIAAATAATAWGVNYIL